MDTYRIGECDHTNKVILWPVMLVQFIYLAYAISAPVGEAYLYITMGLFIAFVFVAFLTSPSILLNILVHKKYLSLLSFMSFYFVTGTLVNGVEQSVKLIGGVILCFSSMFIYDYFEKIALPRQMKTNVVFGMGLLLWLSFFTIIFLQSFQYAARDMASDLSNFEGIAIGGGYGLAYGLSLFSVCLFALILSDSTKKRYKAWLTGCMLVYTATVFQSAYTISILLVLIGVAMTLVTRSSNTKIACIILFLAGFMCLLLYLSFKDDIGLLIVNNFGDESDIVSERITEIGIYMLGSGDSSLDMVARFDLYFMSLFTFFENLFWGLGIETGYLSDDLKLYIGNHSEWFDALGLWGIIGGVPYLLSIYYGIKQKFRLDTMVVPMILFLMLGFVNPVRVIGIFFVMFYLIPALANIVRKETMTRERRV